MKHFKFVTPGFYANGEWAKGYEMKREKPKDHYNNQATRPSTFFLRTVGQSQAPTHPKSQFNH
jgi:hypothetical protein